jgi:glycosyltransferase involved in cell wall biosynthesis
MAKIGVVLATYNGEKFLSEMLSSLVMQTRPADIIFVLDDASSDSSVQIVENFSSKLPIKLWKNSVNTGHRAAFSKILEIARAELLPSDLIALADQDDIWLPEKLEILEKAVFCSENKNPDLVFGDANVIDAKGQIISTSWRKEAKIIESLSLENLMTGYTNLTGCLSLFRVSLLDKVLPIPEDVFVHDQWIGFCAFLNNGYVAIKSPVIKYRLHDDNAIGIGAKHIWKEELCKNLKWSKLLLNQMESGKFEKKSVYFLKDYISYLENRLTRFFLPEYFMWAMKNSKHLYPHVRKPFKILLRSFISILGVPLLEKIKQKK